MFKKILIIGCGLIGSSILRGSITKKISKHYFVYEKSKKNIQKIKKINNKLLNVGGGKKNSINLLQLTKLATNITKNKIKIGKIKKTSSYDVPYFISDLSYVKKIYKWEPKRNLKKVVADLYFWMLHHKYILKKYF